MLSHIPAFFFENIKSTRSLLPVVDGEPIVPNAHNAPSTLAFDTRPAQPWCAWLLFSSPENDMALVLSFVSLGNDIILRYVVFSKARERKLYEMTDPTWKIGKQHRLVSLRFLKGRKSSYHGCSKYSTKIVHLRTPIE